jgi:hypothetical protein
MEQVDRDTGVFVVAPGPVVLFFPKVKALGADLRRMHGEERDRASFYTVAGEVLELKPRGRGFNLLRTGVVDIGSLRSALAAVASDPAAETDPQVVAGQLERGRKSRRLRRSGQ